MIRATSKLFLLLMWGGGSVLYVNVYFDPESNSTARSEHCVEIGVLIKRTCATGVVFAGEFNTQRLANSYLARSMRPGQCLNALHLDYLAGQHTNVVWNGRRTLSTEIDYIFTSRHMRVQQLHVYPGVCTHRALVADIVGLSVTEEPSYSKRYKARAASSEQVMCLSVLLTAYWWWMKRHAEHADWWVHVFRFLADPILHPASLRVSAVVIMRRGRVLAKGVAKANEIQQWHKSIQNLLFQRRLKLNSEVLNMTVSMSHTTKATGVKKSLPVPHPEIEKHARGTPTREESLLEAREQLLYYHCDCGQCMNTPVLHICAAQGADLTRPDDLSFDLLCRHMRDGLRSDHGVLHKRNMLLLPQEPCVTANSMWRAMQRGGSIASSVDDIPFNVITAMPWCATYIIMWYAHLLANFRTALSNRVLQMCIYKSGPRHHCNSYRPIKIGSCINRTMAGVVSEDIVSRGETLGPWGGCVFAYTQELLMHYLAPSARATVSMSLSRLGQCHIVEGDESGAFDRPIRADLTDSTRNWAGRCDYGSWAENFYGRAQVRVWSVKGVAPAATHELGFSQGYSCVATTYTDLGVYRTRGLLTSRQGWW